jgi:ATP-binding cassette subfamily C (CFTR/MRP) protein 1
MSSNHNSAQYFSLADHVVVLENTKVKEQGPWDTLSVLPDEIEKFQTERSQDASNAAKQVPEIPQTGKIDGATADLNRKAGDFAIYNYYFRSAGLRNIFILFCCSSGYSFFNNFQQYWLQLWTLARPEDTWYYVVGILIFSTIAWAGTSASMWSALLKIAPHSGVVMHNALLRTVFGAPLSFFSATENGSILNRFSQDLQLIDQDLPAAVLGLSARRCSTIMVRILLTDTEITKLMVQGFLLFAAQTLLLIGLPFYILLIYVIQKVYLRTSRRLRLLELESQAAVYASFLETVGQLIIFQRYRTY